MRIADGLVVDNDGQHSAKEKSGQAALSKGLHPITVDFIEGGGGFTLKLKCSNGNAKLFVSKSTTYCIKTEQSQPFLLLNLLTISSYINGIFFHATNTCIIDNI